MSSTPPAPPPRRTQTPASTSGLTTPATPEAASTTGWKGKLKANATVWGKKAIDKSVQISDNVGGKVNGIAERRFGTEAFWPVTGDMVRELDKCARILRAFTVDGVVTEEKEAATTSTPTDSDGKKKKKKYRVIRKIPPAVIAQAKGLAIFTSMRTGFAPFGGAGGAGIVVAKLPDGSWSAPASISPNNLTAGFLIGVDVYDCVLVIRSQKALDSFATHKATLGAELAVVGGPYGVGAAVEAGIEKAPVFSYVRSRGIYAGIEVVGQVFVERFDENAAMYHWPGVKAGDILAGKVRFPVEGKLLLEALQDAESGRAQKEKGDALDLVVADGPISGTEAAELDLNDGEVLKLPPLPSQTDGREHESDPETEMVKHPSRPGSHNPSMSDLRAAAQSQAPVHLIPPPLPMRRSQNQAQTQQPTRPPLYEQHSDTSHYSDTLSDTPPTNADATFRDVTIPPSISSLGAPNATTADAGAEDLPSYASQYAEASSAYPSEKGASSTLAAGSLAPTSAVTHDDGEPMSESEKKEWEEFMEEHEAEQKLLRQQQAASASAPQHETSGTGTSDIAILSGRLHEHTLDEEGEGPKGEHEGLR